MHWKQNDLKCTETVLVFQIFFFLNRGSQSSLLMLVGGIKLAIERLSHVTNLCSLSILFVIVRTSFHLLLKQSTLIFITHCLISYRFAIVYIRRDILRRRANDFLEGHELKTVARLIEKRFCKTNSFFANRFPCEAVWLSTNTR